MAQLEKTALEKLRKLGGDDFVNELVETFLKDAPERIEAALAAGRREDLEGIERATHSLASSAAMMGAMELHDLGRSIEHRAADRSAESLLPDLERMAALYREYEVLLQSEIRSS